MNYNNAVRCILLATFVLTTVPALAQEVKLSPRLRELDEFRLEVTRNRENSSRPEQDGKSRTVVNVRVISATPQGFVLDWIPGETVFDNPQLAQDPIIGGVLQAVQDIRFRLTLNAEGKFINLANQAEVVPKLQAILDRIVEGIMVRVPPAQREAFQGAISRVLSPAVLIASATREPEIYFGLNGVVQAAGETTEADIQVPNPLGSGEFAAKFRVHMQSVTSDSASLKTTTTYDAITLQRMTQALAQQVGAPISPEQLAKLPPLQVADDGTYLFDRKVGLMKDVSVQRRVSAANASRYDAWRILLLNGPAR